MVRQTNTCKDFKKGIYPLSANLALFEVGSDTLIALLEMGSYSSTTMCQYWDNC